MYTQLFAATEQPFNAAQEATTAAISLAFTVATVSILWGLGFIAYRFISKQVDIKNTAKSAKEAAVIVRIERMYTDDSITSEQANMLMRAAFDNPDVVDKRLDELDNNPRESLKRRLGGSWEDNYPKALKG